MGDRFVSVKLSAAVGNYKAAMAQAAAATRDLKQEIGQTARQSKADMTQLGQTMTVMGGAVVGAFALAGRSAIAFESSFAGVRKTVNASEAEFAQLSAGFRQMAKDIPTSVNELNAVGEAAGQLGIHTANILGFSRTMADLGVATNLSAQEAATSLARLANITQMPQTEFDRLGSTVVALGNNFATTEAEIVEFGLRLAGAGKQIGLTEAEILGLGAALSSVGINAEAGGTALSKVMIDIASEVANTGDNLALFAQVAGMSAEEFSAAWREDAAGALVDFVEGLGALEEQGGSTLQTLEELGITEQRMRDALLRASGAGDLLRDSLDRGNQAWDENVALAREAAQRYETTESRMRLAGNAVNDLGITIGQLLTPALGGAADIVGGFASGLAALPGPAIALAGGVVALGGAATLAAGGFLMLAPRIAATKAAMTALAADMPRTVGALRMMRGALGPISLALTAATIGIGLWSRQQAAAQRRTEAWKDTLDDTTGALTELSRELAVTKLLEADADQAALKLGVSFSDVTDAILGDEAALRRVNAALDAHTRQARVDAGFAEDAAIPIYNEETEAVETLRDALGLHTADLGEATAAARRQAEANALAAGTFLDLQHGIDQGLDPALVSAILRFKATEDAADGAAGGIGGVGEEAADAADELNDMLDALDLLVSLLFDAENAELRFLDALEDVTGSVEDNGTSLDKHTEKGRANIRAVSDAAEAIYGHAEALLEEGNSLGQVLPVMDQHIAALKEELREAGFTEAQIADLIERYELVPERIATHIAADTAQAEAALASLYNAIGRLPTSLSIRAHLIGPTGARQHAGGWAGTGPQESMMGLGTDEIPAVLQSGEFVLSRDMVRMLKALPRFHGGGMVQPFDAGLIGSLVADATGRGSAGIEATMARIERLMDKWRRIVEEQDRSTRRADLAGNVSDARRDLAGTSGEERAAAQRRLADAIEAVEEHDRAAAQAAEERAIADEQAKLEAELRLAVNREAWQFEQATVPEQLAMIDRRLAREELFTDRWMDLVSQRQRILDQEAQAARRAADNQQRVFDDELADLNRMLDEQERIRRRQADAEQRFLRARADEYARHQTGVAQARADAEQAVTAAISGRRSDLLGQVRPDLGGFGWSASELTSLVDRRVDELGAWGDALAQLQRRGLSGDVIDMLGLADGPQALGQARALLSATDEELARLNRSVADQMAAVNDTVAREQADANSQLASDIADIHRDLTSTLDDLQADHLDRLAQLQEDFADEQAALADELAAIGIDSGRTWADAIAAGIASGLPGIEEQVRRVQQAMRDLKEAEAAAGVAEDRAATSSVAETAAQMRASLGLAPDPVSDQAWAEGVAAGTHDLANLERRLRQKAQSFDSGGVLSPGLTLAYNGTGRDEYVVQSAPWALAAQGGGTSIGSQTNFGDVLVTADRPVDAADEFRRTLRRIELQSG